MSLFGGVTTAERTRTINPAYPALQENWVVVDPNKPHLSRRDFFKLAGVGAAVIAVLTGCGPAAQATESQAGNSEIPIPNSEDVPGFGRPVRPWSIDLTTGIALPTTAELGKQVARTFNRWINPVKPLVELHDMQQMVVRVPNNSGAGTELGFETQKVAVDLQAERAKSGFSLTDSAKGEQYVRPGVNGALTSFTDYAMTSPLPQDSEKKAVNPDKNIGEQHYLKDADGNRFKLPGNATQMLNLMQLVNYLYARVVNDNIYGLSDVEKFNKFYEQRNSLIADILLVPQNGEAQIRSVGLNYLRAIGVDTSNEEIIKSSLDEVMGMISKIAEVDPVSIPSARLAVSIAAGLVKGEVALFNDGQSPDYSEQLNIKRAYLSQNVPDAVVVFDQEKAVDAAVENEWLRIPISKPRAFEVIVQTYEENKKDGKGEQNKGYERKIIFSSHLGDTQAHTDKSGGPEFKPLLTQALFDIDPKDLEDQQIISSTKKDNIFFTTEKTVGDVKGGQRIIELKEIDSTSVRLFSLPGGKMQWGIHTAQSGTVPMGMGNQIAAWLGSAYDKLPYQEIIMDDGTHFQSSIDGYFQKGWATDVTERWLEWKRSGLKEVTKMGALTPDEYLARLSVGSMFQPQGAFLSQTLLGRYAQMDIENEHLDTLKTNNVIAALENMPLYQVNGGVGQQVDILAKGDVITCDYSIIMVNGEPMIQLFENGGLQYAVPIDFAKLQMIDSGTRDRIIESAKTWVPLALLLIPYGKVVGNGAKNLLKLFLK